METMKNKTYVEDVNRSIYDIKDKVNASYKASRGLTSGIVNSISLEKNDPAWMREFRQKSLKIYNELDIPVWGPSIEGLHMEDIVTYVKPNTKMQLKWEEVP